MNQSTRLAFHTITSTLALVLVATADAQGPSGTARKVDGAANTAQNNPALAGLPTWLIQVPAGKVVLGLPADKLVEVCAESVPPHDPKRVDPNNPNFAKALRNTVSELGRQTVEVREFLLAKWPITNKEYRVFAEKTGARTPYHWWRWGKQDDYFQRLEDINKEFPQDRSLAPVLYWERHWKDLPYELKDEFGNSIENQPVRFVSWRDAMRCAGWLGMRLPTEAEWTRAARGDNDNAWLWGKTDQAVGDHYSAAMLGRLQLQNGRDQRVKDVGAVAFATGPFGHLDMVGQVWEWTSTREFRPLGGEQAFVDEWKKLQRDKAAASLTAPPLWNDSRVIIKGGSYLSWGDPVQFHIDSRMGIETTQTVEAVGFRLAKTPRPGFDMLYSLVRGGDYDQRAFGPEQVPNLDDQVGIERYDLAANGFPEAYHAASFVPVNFLTRDKGVDVRKLAEQSQTAPILVGTLASSMKLAEPALDANIYSVFYRQKGMPRELQDALKTGFKAVQAELKRRDKAGEQKAEEKVEEWRTVIAKYGIEPKDLEDKDALDKIKFVRIGGVEISTEHNSLLFMNNEGKFTGTVTLRTENLGTSTSYSGATIELDVPKDKQRLTIKFGVPIEQRNPKRVAEISMPIVLDQGPQPADKPWRLP